MTGHSTKHGKSAQSHLMKFGHIAKGKHIYQKICIANGSFYNICDDEWNFAASMCRVNDSC
jgi:hypothetical protein